MTPDINFRDVGLALKEFGDDRLPPGRLLRSGQKCEKHILTRPPRTIIGLRTFPAWACPVATYIHHPFPAGAVKYDGRDPRVHSWIEETLTLLDNDDYALPILVHCAHGVDRTGMIISALLTALNVPFPVIAKEYTLSPGADPIRFSRFWSDLSTYGPGLTLSLRNPHRFTA
jgi:hypothetical protein